MRLLHKANMTCNIDAQPLRQGNRWGRATQDAKPDGELWSSIQPQPQRSYWVFLGLWWIVWRKPELVVGNSQSGRAQTSNWSRQRIPIIERSIVWHGLKQLVSSCYSRWHFGDLVLKGKTIIRHIIQEIIRQITHFRHQWTPLCLPWTIPVATPVVSTMGSKSKLGSMLSIRNGAQLFLCKIWHNYAKGSKPLAKPPSKKEKLLLEAKDNNLSTRIHGKPWSRDELKAKITVLIE